MTPRKPPAPKDPLDALRDQLNAHESQIRALGERVGDNDRKVSAFHTRLDAVTTKQEQDNGSFITLGQQVSGISTQLGAVISEQSQFRVLMETQSGKVASLDMAVTEFNERLATFSHDLSEVLAMKPAIEALQSVVTKLTEQSANWMTREEILAEIGKGGTLERSVKAFGDDLKKSFRASIIKLIVGAGIVYLLVQFGISQWEAKAKIDMTRQEVSQTKQEVLKNREAIEEKAP